MKASIAEVVLSRAGDFCECGCGNAFVPDSFLERATLDHFFGRARAESVDTVWAIRAICHDGKTHNWPSAAFWMKRFLVHAEKHNYRAAYEKAFQKLQVALTKQSLPYGTKGAA